VRRGLAADGFSSVGLRALRAPLFFGSGSATGTTITSSVLSSAFLPLARVVRPRLAVSVGFASVSLAVFDSSIFDGKSTVALTFGAWTTNMI